MWWSATCNPRVGVGKQEDLGASLTSKSGCGNLFSPTCEAQESDPACQAPHIFFFFFKKKLQLIFRNSGSCCIRSSLIDYTGWPLGSQDSHLYPARTGVTDVYHHTKSFLHSAISELVGHPELLPVFPKGHSNSSGHCQACVAKPIMLGKLIFSLVALFPLFFRVAHPSSAF